MSQSEGDRTGVRLESPKTDWGTWVIWGIKSDHHKGFLRLLRYGIWLLLNVKVKTFNAKWKNLTYDFLEEDKCLVNEVHDGRAPRCTGLHRPSMGVPDKKRSWNTLCIFFSHAGVLLDKAQCALCGVLAPSNIYCTCVCVLVWVCVGVCVYTRHLPES